MPRPTDEIIRLRITWLVIFVLGMATIAPFLMLLGELGDPNRARRAELLYNLLFLLVGYIVGGAKAEGQKP